MAANVRLLIVDPDINHSTELKKQLSRSGITVVGETDYGASAISLSQATHPDAVCVAWKEPTARAKQTLESLALLLPAAPLLAYSTIGELAAARQAIQSGAHDYLVEPIEAKEFLDALHKALAQIERRRLSESGAGEGIGQGIVISLFGAKGGIGKTTLSTNLAIALSKVRQESVALVDIDTRFGDVAIVLDLDPSKNIGDAARMVDELDRFNITSYLIQHSSGIRVLAAPNRPSEWQQVKPGHIEKIIKLLAQTHDYVILDTPGFFTELVGVALDMSDLVLLITTLDLSSIKDSGMAVSMLEGADYPMERLKIVVNHPTQVNGIGPKQVADVTGFDVFWQVPYDKAFAKAGQLGAAIVLKMPKAKGARSIIQLAYSISGGRQERKLFNRNRDRQPEAGLAVPLINASREG